MASLRVEYVGLDRDWKCSLVAHGSSTDRQYSVFVSAWKLGPPDSHWWQDPLPTEKSLFGLLDTETWLQLYSNHR